MEHHDDDHSRGFKIQSLQKSNKFQGKVIEDIVVQSINPGKERGGHYHKRKTEWFMALCGEASLIWSEKTDPEEKDLKIIPLKTDFNRPYMLEVQPMICHWIRNRSKEIFLMVSFSTEEYNFKEPDSVKVSIDKRK